MIQGSEGDLAPGEDGVMWGGGGDRERKGEHGVLIPKFPLWDNPQIL